VLGAKLNKKFIDFAQITNITGEIDVFFYQFRPRYFIKIKNFKNQDFEKTHEFNN